MTKAEQLAEERYPDTSPFEMVITHRQAQRAAFIAGLQVGMEFAEFTTEFGQSKVGDKHYWHDSTRAYTTEQLFEIFLNEKHDTTTH